MQARPDMDFDDSRLDRFIRRLCNARIPQSAIEKALRNKDILVNGKRAKASDRVSDSDEVYIYTGVLEAFKAFNLEPKTKPAFNNQSSAEEFKTLIVYEDENLIIVNKPSGLAVQLGTNTNVAVDVMARAYDKEARLVHRIDKDTSGICILSKNLRTSRYMLHLFRQKLVKKTYLAILSNTPSRRYGVIEARLIKHKETVIVDQKEGKEALTEYEILKTKGKKALAKLKPKTGRTHQIRVHMQYLNCPILGDSKYGGERYCKLCLHSHNTTFKDMEGKTIQVSAPLPDYFDI
jgi:23S rRNA pseudouridine955/2504/2580 synthase